VAEIRNSRKLQTLAVQLRQACAEREVFLAVAVAEAQAILVGKVQDIANQLGAIRRPSTLYLELSRNPEHLFTVPRSEACP
jgi:hypothetical protein